MERTIEKENRARSKKPKSNNSKIIRLKNIKSVSAFINGAVRGGEIIFRCIIFITVLFVFIINEVSIEPVILKIILFTGFLFATRPLFDLIDFFIQDLHSKEE